MKDRLIIEKIRKGGRQFENAADELFETHTGFIFEIMNKLGLSEALAKDAYADALVKLIRNIKSDQFKEQSKLSTYFYSIFYNTAVDIKRKKPTNETIGLDQVINYSDNEKDILDLMNLSEQTVQLISKIHQLGKTCQKVLIDWGYHGYSMEEIANRVELNSASSARSMKYKCLKQLKALLKNKVQ